MIRLIWCGLAHPRLHVAVRHKTHPRRKRTREGTAGHSQAEGGDLSRLETRVLSSVDARGRGRRAGVCGAHAQSQGSGSLACLGSPRRKAASVFPSLLHLRAMASFCHGGCRILSLKKGLGPLSPVRDASMDAQSYNAGVLCSQTSTSSTLVTCTALVFSQRDTAKTRPHALPAASRKP